ncbi:MAG: hypothetical protein HOV68_29345 [Streptomycetaceae bacterium]|nr:hypothetical protein [Streptomycetaceae bacterium]
MSSDDAGAARFLDAVRALVTAASAQGPDAARVRAEALAAVGEWTAGDKTGGGAPDVSHILRGITDHDRALLNEALRTIAAWVREPGEESGRRVDDVVGRMQRELGPLIARDRDAEQAADRERLRADIRSSIRLRLRETGALGED